MIDAEMIKMVQILALKAVEEPSSEDVYNKICRWYSKEFCTPLPQVLDLDPVHVLQNFFEQRYEAIRDSGDKGDAEFEKIKEYLLFPEEVDRADKAADDWVKRLEAEMKAEQDRKNGVKSAADQVADSMAQSMINSVEKALEELNLTDVPDAFKLPDSGSMGD